MWEYSVAGLACLLDILLYRQHEEKVVWTGVGFKVEFIHWKKLCGDC